MCYSWEEIPTTRSRHPVSGMWTDTWDLRVRGSSGHRLSATLWTIFCSNFKYRWRYRLMDHRKGLENVKRGVMNKTCQIWIHFRFNPITHKHADIKKQTSNLQMSASCCTWRLTQETKKTALCEFLWRRRCVFEVCPPFWGVARCYWILPSYLDAYMKICM